MGFIENFNLKDNYFSFSIIAQKRGPKGVVGNQPVQRLGPQPGGGGHLGMVWLSCAAPPWGAVAVGWAVRLK